MKKLLLLAAVLSLPVVSLAPRSAQAMGRGQVLPWGRFPVTGVSPGIYRGGRPDPEDYEDLVTIGVRTIIDLENDSRIVDPERDYFSRTPVEFVNFGMDGLHQPDEAGLQNVLSILANPAKYPVYVHCEHGMDRTGLIIGLYRVQVEGWKPKDAWREMRQYQFRPFLPGLYRSFVKHTGYNPYLVPVF
jgi:protein tyrosine/serine phosphatase